MASSRWQVVSAIIRCPTVACSGILARQALSVSSAAPGDTSLNLYLLIVFQSAYKPIGACGRDYTVAWVCTPWIDTYTVTLQQRREQIW